MANWDRIRHDFNYWGEYREGSNNWVRQDTAWVQANWRQNNWGIGPPAQQALPDFIPAVSALGPVQELDPDPPEVLSPAAQAFMLTNPLGANWAGRKFLGQGGYGIVGLWEYTGPAVNKPDETNIVVKETNLPAKDLRHEGRMLNRLGRGRSQHIAKMVAPYRVIDGTEGLGPEWTDKVKRLFLEYCPMGDLSSLLARRDQMQKPFKEVTLWAMFNCLVDGVSRMADGVDITYDRNLNENNAMRFQLADWNEIVHFDIKPENILLGEKRDDYHQAEPVFKFADFGCAQRPGNPGADLAWTAEENRRRERWRSLGTKGFYTPEQFTERWDARDYQTAGIAGRYSYKTNIWGVGGIMYSMALISLEPSAQEPFMPGNLNGQAAKGISYGQTLQILNIYSTALKDLIIECLYQDPNHRPALEDLKNRVVAGLSSAIQTNPVHELREDFLAYNDPLLVAARTAKEAANQAMEDEINRRLAARVAAQPPAQAAPTAAQIAAQIAAQVAAQALGQVPIPLAQQAANVQAAATQAAQTALANAIANHALARNTFNGITMRCHARVARQCNNIFQTDGARFRCIPAHEGRGVPNPYPLPAPVPPSNYFTGARIWCSLDQCNNHFITDGARIRCTHHNDLVRFPIGMIRPEARARRNRRARN